jgi:glycosyltransferase involved in cell wall biosynthesis
MKEETLVKKVSVVVCVMNVADFVRDCLLSIKHDHPYEIIVVDGMSTDGTIKIAEEIADFVISDQGKGLSFARKIGAEKATGDYVLYIGPDNRIETGFIKNFVKLLHKDDLDGASLKTVVENPTTYWDKGLDFRWKLLMNRKEKITVLGTPSLYKKSMLEDENFSGKDISAGDDTDLGQRLINKAYKLGIVDMNVFDKNMWTFAETYNRFKWYGTGDYYFYRDNSGKWKLSRKIKSLTHPLRQSVSYSYIALISGSPIIIGWFFITMLARYSGWVSEYFNSRN